MNIRCLLLAMVLTLFSAGPSSAAGKKIVIGIIPEMNLLKQMNRYEPVCKYISRKTGIEIELKPFSSYGRIYEKIRDREIDGGFFGSFIYAITRSRVGIEPLARPQMVDGSSTYSGVLFVRKDSGINKIEDLKGQTIALVEPSTTGGYLAQKEVLQHHGIDVDKDMKIIWKGSHEEVMTAVMLHEATTGGAKDSAVRKYTENRHFSKQIRVLAKSPKEPVPENALALHRSISPALRAKIKDALLSMDADPAGRRALATFGARRFIETTDADYRPLYNLINHMKIDLQTCPYQRQ